MTTSDYYRASVKDFAEHITEEYRYYELIGYDVAQCSLFAVLMTEIYFLREHYAYLQSLRERKDWLVVYMQRTIDVRKKLEQKQAKYERYVKELL